MGEDFWGLVYDRQTRRWYPDHACQADGRTRLFYWFDADCAEKTLDDQGQARL